jgi:hypothetical protein
LTIQGLTLKPLLRALDLQDNDPVGRELGGARDRALQAALATLDGDQSVIAGSLRQEFAAYLAAAESGSGGDEAGRATHGNLHRTALEAARRAVLAMRDRDEIGDDAFHQIEEELDWLEMAGRSHQ